MKIKNISIFCIMILTLSNLNAQDFTQKSLNVTIYNNNLGVIRDVREMVLKSGKSEIRIKDVAEKIDPTSVLINLKGTVLEQNYQYDLAGLGSILDKYIDKEIELKKEQNSFKGTLLSFGSNDVVLQKADGGLVMLPDIKSYQILVGSLPDGLITKPTLVWLVNAKSGGKQDVELSYHTEGLNWHAEYVAMLNDDDTKLDLNAWVSIENYSGATYKDANLKLVAGKVHLIEQMRTTYDYIDNSLGLAKVAEAEPPQFEEKPFFEYHIYDLQRPATIANNEIKQISLFSANVIKAQKKYVYDKAYIGSSNNKIKIVVEFENSKENNLGMPFPKGKIRMNKSDGETIEFIGEDMIDHTPKNEKIKLNIGEAFDVLADEILEDQQWVSDKVREFTYKITFKNRKEENINIDVERYLGTNWTILECSHKYEKKDALRITLSVPVKKDSETILKYKVRYVTP